MFGADLGMVASVPQVDVVHSHTWYANLGGLLTWLFQNVPHVVTAHSLEPHRPWKAEQLAGGYRLSSWAERTAFEAADAVIAYAGNFVPAWAGAIAIDLLPAVLVFIIMVVQAAIRSGRGEGHSDERMTVGELRAALAASDLLRQIDATPPPAPDPARREV